jgi:hypothetical protein
LDTLGNSIQSFKVEVSRADGSAYGKFRAPKTIRLPNGRFDFEISASMHRPAQQTVDVSEDVRVLVFGLVRPTGSEISGTSREPNSAVELPATEIKPTPGVITTLRLIGIYSPYFRDLKVQDDAKPFRITNLPFGEYRALLMVNGKAVKEFLLKNEEFKPLVFHALAVQGELGKYN